jgi:hypothetical protein
MAHAQDADPLAGMAGMHHDMPGMDHGSMADQSMAGMTMNPPEVGMAGVSGSLGFYPFQREASGTAWQPDASARAGLRDHAGAWLLLLRGDIAAGYSQAGGGRGGEGGFGSGVLSVTARRDFETMDVVQLRARVSPDTALNAAFADGQGRQAPRAALEELSAVFSHRIAITDTVFAYAAPVGQPAFGAPLWFDRLSSGGRGLHRRLGAWRLETGRVQLQRPGAPAGPPDGARAGLVVGPHQRQSGPRLGPAGLMGKPQPSRPHVADRR